MTRTKKAAIAFSVAVLAFIATIWVANSSTAAGHTTIVGTEQRDVIKTGNGGLTIVWALGGNDRLGGGNGTDLMHGGRGNDVIFTGPGGAKEAAWGGRGRDRINDWSSGQSPGYLNGGAGRHDTCIGDKHDTFVRCETIIWK